MLPKFECRIIPNNRCSSSDFIRPSIIKDLQKFISADKEKTMWICGRDLRGSQRPLGRVDKLNAKALPAT